jgi:hypothetical protein
MRARLRQTAQRLGLAQPSTAERMQRLGLRPFTPAAPGPPEPRELPFGPLQLTDNWGAEFELWLGNKLTVYVRGTNRAQIQLARTRPPAPPVWGGPVTLDPGPWSHVGEFGYFRFRNGSPGLIALVEGTAYSE